MPVSVPVHVCVLIVRRGRRIRGVAERHTPQLRCPKLRMLPQRLATRTGTGTSTSASAGAGAGARGAAHAAATAAHWHWQERGGRQ